MLKDVCEDDAIELVSRQVGRLQHLGCVASQNCVKAGTGFLGHFIGKLNAKYRCLISFFETLAESPNTATHVKYVFGRHGNQLLNVFSLSYIGRIEAIIVHAGPLNDVVNY